MELQDVSEFARNFAVMVRIQGPDPKGLKMRRHAFHLHQSGNTTLSASGLLLPPGSLRCPPPIISHICSIHHHSGAIVITAASIVEPFLLSRQRSNLTQEFYPILIPDAQIDVLLEGVKVGSSHDETEKNPRWLPSQLLALVDVSASSSALLSLLGIHTNSPERASWEIGWSLPSLTNGPQSKMDSFQGQGDNGSKTSLEESCELTAKLATRIAFLGVPLVNLKDLLHIDISQPQKRGDLLVVMGSPFGVLSPLHFFNSISAGSVANCCPPSSHNSSLLMADIRCLPGMEGGPVFNRHACLTGILMTPLRQKGSRAEIQLVITWDAIVTAWQNESKMEPQISQGELVERKSTSISKVALRDTNVHGRSVTYLPPASDFPYPPKSSFEKAISSIVLVTVGDGVWASGIVLNNHGLILTNAHILEPWRFGRTSLLGLMEKTSTLSDEKGGPLSEREDINGDNKKDISKMRSINASVVNQYEALSYRNYKRISVRLDHVEPKMWCDAGVVYVSRGPFDVALLQLKSVPDQLRAITSDSTCPSKGLAVHVIGHGLLGPHSDIRPSVFSGILASVVTIPERFRFHESIKSDTDERYIPVMLQTTASVHPGASGGAVVNSDGHMIGLVTSNAKHGGGTIIPHLNFSIPCSALEPIFKFSETQDLSTLEVLDKQNELISSVWSLVPPSSPNMQSIIDKNKKDGRGSRFSKFLSEKNADLASLVDQERLNKEKLPSKI